MAYPAVLSQQTDLEVNGAQLFSRALEQLADDILLYCVQNEIDEDNEAGSLLAFLEMLEEHIAITDEADLGDKAGFVHEVQDAVSYAITQGFNGIVHHDNNPNNLDLMLGRQPVLTFETHVTVAVPAHRNGQPAESREYTLAVRGDSYASRTRYNEYSVGINVPAIGSSRVVYKSYHGNGDLNDKVEEDL